MQILNVDLFDVYAISEYLDVNSYAPQNDFTAFQFSPYIDIDML